MTVSLVSTCAIKHSSEEEDLFPPPILLHHLFFFCLEAKKKSRTFNEFLRGPFITSRGFLFISTFYFIWCYLDLSQRCSVSHPSSSIFSSFEKYLLPVTHFDPFPPPPPPLPVCILTLRQGGEEKKESTTNLLAATSSLPRNLLPLKSPQKLRLRNAKKQ